MKKIAMREFSDYKNRPVSAIRIVNPPKKGWASSYLNLGNVTEEIMRRYPKGTPEAKLLEPTTSALRSLKKSVASGSTLRPSDIEIDMSPKALGNQFMPTNRGGMAMATNLGPATIGHEVGHGIDSARGLSMGKRGIFGLGGVPKTMIPSEVSATRHAIKHIKRGRKLSELPASARREIAKVLSSTSTYIESARPMGLSRSLATARLASDKAVGRKKKERAWRILSGLYKRAIRFEENPKLVKLKRRLDTEIDDLLSLPYDHPERKVINARMAALEKEIAPLQAKVDYVKSRAREMRIKEENLTNPYKTRVWSKMNEGQRRAFVSGIDDMGKQIDKYFGKELGALYREELKARVEKPDMRGLEDRKAAWRGGKGRKYRNLTPAQHKALIERLKRKEYGPAKVRTPTRPEPVTKADQLKRALTNLGRNPKARRLAKAGTAVAAFKVLSKLLKKGR